MTDGRIPHVVTIGGGHGQSAVLAALRMLDCRITAIIAVADDGGCSGKLREEIGMPPPGDLRRCLTALAANEKLAARFDLRLQSEGIEGRSAGNLALAAEYHRHGSLQKAVDWAARMLRCRGRVVPVAETAAVLAVYDLERGVVEGETNVERSVAAPLVAVVEGPTQTNPVALDAVADADLLLIGPGSFYTSTLSAVATADMPRAIACTHARRVLLSNLAPEGEQTRGFRDEDYVRVLRDHLTIGSMGESVSLEVLRHGDTDAEGRLADGTPFLQSPLAEPGTDRHDPALVARALARHLGLVPHDARPSVVPSATLEEYESAFEQSLEEGKSLIR
ncbi:MAG: YvcK family protein [Deltaproteobacteria bacterium]|nr:YvcK family protein [Deltaproteobacteria bacterium]